MQLAYRTWIFYLIFFPGKKIYHHHTYRSDCRSPGRGCRADTRLPAPGTLAGTDRTYTGRARTYAGSGGSSSHTAAGPAAPL